MARLTFLLSLITAAVALLGGFRWLVREWRAWRRSRGHWLTVLVLCLVPSASWAVYSLPNDDGDCPANCRQIPWSAGSDLWNGGTLPVRTGIACTSGLTEGDGTTDNTAAIETCLANISSNQASVLPAGIYYIAGTLDIPANKSLRGANGHVCTQGTWLSTSWRGDTGGGAGCTTLKLGTSGYVNMDVGATKGTTYNLSSGYDKGSTSIVTSTTPSNIATGDYVVIHELSDSAIPVSITGTSGACNWCGDIVSASGRVMVQFIPVTNVSGTTITLGRPLYYTFKSALTPQITEYTGMMAKAGLEDLKVDGYVNRTTRTAQLIRIAGCAYCWVKNVEVYASPASSKAFPLYMEWDYGIEIRDGYFHWGVANASDENYSPGLFFVNSDNKIENNVFRENRHCMTMEGGGSGNVFLYNYCDDQWTDDLTYLASGRASHGAHPYFNLWEGNIASHFSADPIWGTSSHNVFWRNWLWGDATGNYTGWTGTDPSWGFVALEISFYNKYYSAVGNVLGNNSLHTTWSGASVFTAACSWSQSRSAPRVYGLGCDSNGEGIYDSAVRSTLISHGNYDYKTVGQAHWDGGADHAIGNSMYYGSKPAFFGSCAWPPFDGTQSPPTINPLPAKERYNGLTTCDESEPGAPGLLGMGGTTMTRLIYYVELAGIGVTLWHLWAARMTILRLAQQGRMRVADMRHASRVSARAAATMALSSVARALERRNR